MRSHFFNIPFYLLLLSPSLALDAIEPPPGPPPIDIITVQQTINQDLENEFSTIDNHVQTIIVNFVPVVVEGPVGNAQTQSIIDAGFYTIDPEVDMRSVTPECP
jgi:hypothetical protein